MTKLLVPTVGAKQELPVYGQCTSTEALPSASLLFLQETNLASHLKLHYWGYNTAWWIQHSQHSGQKYVFISFSCLDLLFCFTGTGSRVPSNIKICSSEEAGLLLAPLCPADLYHSKRACTQEKNGSEFLVFSGESSSTSWSLLQGFACP